MSTSDDAQAAEFVGPAIIDTVKFNQIAVSEVYDRLKVEDRLLPSNNNIIYEGTFDGKPVYILNCKCLSDVKIIDNTLVAVHSYGGGESNRDSTILLWNGKHYQNSKGEYVVDAKVFSYKIDTRRAFLQEKKVLDIAPVQVKGVNFVWINLVGYNGLIKYAY